MVAVDARVFDASADARVFDAQVDAPPAFDARPPVDAAPIADAAPVIDGAPGIDAAPTFDAPPVCTSDPRCSAVGSICTDGDTVANCTLVTGTTDCFEVTGAAPCTGAPVCVGGACVCPAPAGNVAGGGCAQLQAQTCSDDGRAVLTCAAVDGCNVWTVRDPAADQCDVADGTGDGLTCNSNQCICPQNPTSIFYANPVVDRTARPGLVRRGNRFPAICSFDTMTLALAAASSPQFAETGMAVAAKDDPSPANLGLPAVFRVNEAYPMIIPVGRIMTTTDDPVSGVGGTGNFTPTNFVLEVNNHTGGEDASIIVEGTNARTGRGASIRGLTLIEGSCAGDTCDLPGVALQIRNHGTPASTFSAVNSVLVEGGGGSVVGQSASASGIRTGTITAEVDGDTVTIEISGDDNDDAFTGLSEGDTYFIGLAGSADPAHTGLFLVEEFVNGNTVIVKNPDAAADATFAGTLITVANHDWDIGIQVTNSNATLATMVVRNFASFGGGEDRVGLQPASDFTGSPAQGAEADVISIQGGRFYLNDTGIQVLSDNGAQNVSIGPFTSPGGPVPVRVDNSMNIGIHMNDGTTLATGVLQTGTFADGDLGVGYLITGSADVTLTGVTGTGNAEDGVLYLAGGSGSLIDNGSTFTANGSDGVEVANGNETAKPQAIEEANVELRGTTLTANEQYGLNVTADEHVVWLRGGTVSSNGTDGINQTGDSLLVTNGQAADAVLNVDSNGDSGLEATEGEVRLFNTGFSLNGQTNHCGPTEDQASDAVIIDGNATLHAVGINVNDNRGGGVVIGTDNDNTIEASAIQNNDGIDTCGSNETNPSIGAGVNVLAGSTLDFVEEGSSVQGNARVGVYVAGSVDAPVALTVLANGWTGIMIADTGSMTQTGGTVNANGSGPGTTAFNEGVDVQGDYTSTGTEYLGNAGDGVLVNLNDSANRATLILPSIHNNTGNGVNVVSAPGGDADNVDTLDAVAEEDYGFIIRFNLGPLASVFANGGDGLRFGSDTQTKDIVAKVGDTNIFDNTGVGIRVLQATSQGPGVPCVDGGGGCTGVTIVSNRIFRNTGGGVNLRTAFIKRLLVVGGGEQRAFAGNDIFHNALATCAGPQTASQIFVSGRTGLVEGVCAGQSDTTCALQNDPNSSSNDNPGFNNQCILSGGVCLVAWDLSTALTCAAPNSIRDYVRDMSNPTDGGMRAVGGARVLADGNNWRVNPPARGQDYSESSDPGTVIKADLACTGSTFACIENR